MQRRREAEMSSEIRSAIQELSAAKERSGFKPSKERCADDLRTTLQIPIKPFLSICKLLIQVLGSPLSRSLSLIAGSFVAAGSFIAAAADLLPRLEKVYDSDPLTYWDVVEILKKEGSEGKAKKGPTCSKAFVWLTRPAPHMRGLSCMLYSRVYSKHVPNSIVSFDFSVALLKLLVKNIKMSIEQAIEVSYNITLKPWHGWISSAAYKVSLKLVPDTKSLIDILKAKDANDDMLKKEVQTLISLLVPELERSYGIMRMYGLDKLKSI
ncbi:glycolipid transfer protein 3-like [Olea europaea var. sylvestris]|uniref:glycolipid transfer protein 3-like n=1 Tax=Olea europaea var. sylvestris TaxID=158386 RepID=UPI000C1D1ABB|nr:glycolipid transfer protein 3-like [Olea europaea var. sylvestris]